MNKIVKLKTITKLISPERPTKFVIVHIFLSLPLPPEPGHGVRVGQPELTRAALPADAGAVVLRAVQQLQQELPQLHLPASAGAGKETSVVFTVQIRAYK